MSIWKLPRVPEPEVMDGTDGVESYSSAAAARHLDAIDNTFVDHVLRLLQESQSAKTDLWALDIGTGPALIPIKLLQRKTSMRVVAIDRSHAMLDRARQNAHEAGIAARLFLTVSDGHALPFRDAVFSIVFCNSVLHHVREPVRLLREMARVAMPEAPLLVRDLRRPFRPLLSAHLWRHGRHYSGLMRKLFDDSVRAAYTVDELNQFIRESKIQGLSAFRFRGAHVVIERHPPRAVPTQK